MIYLDAKRYGEEKLAELKSLAKQQGTLTAQDIRSVVMRD